MKIEPSPTPEETAAITAALDALREEDFENSPSLKRSRWRLAGLLGHAVGPGMKLEASPWSYPRWEDIT